MKVVPAFHCQWQVHDYSKYMITVTEGFQATEDSQSLWFKRTRRWIDHFNGELENKVARKNLNLKVVNANFEIPLSEIQVASMSVRCWTFAWWGFWDRSKQRRSWDTILWINIAMFFFYYIKIRFSHIPQWRQPRVWVMRDLSRCKMMIW